MDAMGREMDQAWPQWLRAAHTEGARVEITDDQHVIWHDGDWRRGLWRRDDWPVGDWRRGLWRYGDGHGAA